MFSIIVSVSWSAYERISGPITKNKKQLQARHAVPPENMHAGCIKTVHACSVHKRERKHVCLCAASVLPSSNACICYAYILQAHSRPAHNRTGELLWHSRVMSAVCLLLSRFPSGRFLLSLKNPVRLLPLSLYARFSPFSSPLFYLHKLPQHFPHKQSRPLQTDGCRHGYPALWLFLL